MDIIRVIVGIAVVLGLAVLLGMTQNSKHPATHFYAWVSAIFALLLIRWFL